MLDKVKKGKMCLAHRAHSMDWNGHTEFIPWTGMSTQALGALGKALEAGTELGIGGGSSRC